MVSVLDFQNGRMAFCRARMIHNSAKGILKPDFLGINLRRALSDDLQLAVQYVRCRSAQKATPRPDSDRRSLPSCLLFSVPLSIWPLVH